jgi:hypothetical protein
MKRNAIRFFVASVLVSALMGCSKDTELSKSYTRVGISKLTIVNYPQVNDNGDDWDSSLSGVYPDVYFRLTKSGTVDALYTLATSSRLENLRVVDLPRSWADPNGGTFYVLGDLNQAVDVNLYDYDSINSDEYIGTVTVDFGDYTSGSSKYPSTITKTSGSVSVKLEVVWLE